MGLVSELSYVVWLCHVAMSVKEGHKVLVLPGLCRPQIFLLAHLRSTPSVRNCKSF